MKRVNTTGAVNVDNPSVALSLPIKRAVTPADLARAWQTYTLLFGET